jgi:hypothetical protein
MNFPVWDMPLLGGGMLIGIIAILHVFVSHFAVGGGLYLVLTERRAYREDDPGLLAYVRRHTRFFILVVLVFGAVSGAGIWWTIGLITPTATSTLIHTFVWGWAIEWVFFLIEIAAAFVYYYGWDRLDRRTHMAVGWIYTGAAWMSLVIINGILTFMLTPGRWLETRSFWDGWANPTMLPSLVIRTAVAVALAGLYALLTATTIEERELRHRVTRYSAGWVLIGCAVLPFAGLWYVGRIPPLAREISMGGAPAVTLFALLSIVLSAVMVLFTYFGPYRNPRFSNVVLVAVLGFLGLSATAVTEWVREAVRKPYIIYGYMYSNSVRVEDRERLTREGVLKNARWATIREVTPENELAAGEQVFRVQCQACHTVDGYNGIRPMVRGWREEFLDVQLQHLNELKGFMPPFTGSEAERKALAKWLHKIGQEGPFGREPLPRTIASHQLTATRPEEVAP